MVLVGVMGFVCAIFRLSVVACSIVIFSSVLILILALVVWHMLWALCSN